MYKQSDLKECVKFVWLDKSSENITKGSVYECVEADETGMYFINDTCDTHDLSYSHLKYSNISIINLETPKGRMEALVNGLKIRATEWEENTYVGFTDGGFLHSNDMELDLLHMCLTYELYEEPKEKQGIELFASCKPQDRISIGGGVFIFVRFEADSSVSVLDPDGQIVSFNVSHLKESEVTFTN